MTTAQGSLTATAWSEMHRANARPLYLFLLRLTLGNTHDAEDYLQETFARAWRWLQQRPSDLPTIRPWLFTVARRIVIDAARARRSRPVETVLDDLCLPIECSQDIERFALVHTVRTALKSLSSDHRAVLMELYYHGRTLKEAAVVLGIPEGTVKSRAHYAVRALGETGLRELATQCA